MTASLISELAQRYETLPASAPTSTELQAFRDWLRHESQQITAPIVYVRAELKPQETLHEFRQTGRLLVSTAHNCHPYFTRCENNLFRAVHDWHHLQIGPDFTFKGEVCAYLKARSTAPQAIWWILFCEIVAQAAACLHFGEFRPQRMVKF
jgi:hypothetical protein